MQGIWRSHLVPVMFSALGQEIASHFLAQCLQRVELLVEQLGSTAHAGFRYLVQPFRAVAWSIDGCVAQLRYSAFSQFMTRVRSLLMVR